VLLRIEATREELRTKSDDLIKALAREMAIEAPALSDELMKAVLSKEPSLKYPVLRELHQKTSGAYSTQINQMMNDIGAVLDAAAKGDDIPSRLSKSIDDGDDDAGDDADVDPEKEDKAQAKKEAKEAGVDINGDELEKAGFIRIPDAFVHDWLLNKARADEDSDNFDFNEADYDYLSKALAGPFMGPRGGKWADAAHTVPWKESEAKAAATEQLKIGPISEVEMGSKTQALTKYSVANLESFRSRIGSYAKRLGKLPPNAERWLRAVNQAISNKQPALEVRNITSTDVPDTIKALTQHSLEELTTFQTTIAEKAKTAEALGRGTPIMLIRWNRVVGIAIDAKEVMSEVVDHPPKEEIKAEPKTGEHVVSKENEPGWDRMPESETNASTSNEGDGGLSTKETHDEPKINKEMRGKYTIEHAPGVFFGTEEGAKDAAKLPAAEAYTLALTPPSMAPDGEVQESVVRTKLVKKWPLTAEEKAYVESKKIKKKVVPPKKVIRKKVTKKKVTKKKPVKRKAAKKKEPKEGDLTEIGDHVWGSRKDLAEIATAIRAGRRELTNADLAKLDYGDAAYLVTKKNLVPVHSLETLRGLGLSPGAAHMALTIINAIGAKPPDTALGREQYTEDVRNVVASITRAATLKDVKNLYMEWIQSRVVQPRYVADVVNSSVASERATELTEETGIDHRVKYSSRNNEGTLEIIAFPPPPFDALGKRFSTLLKTLNLPTWYSSGNKKVKDALNHAIEAEAAGEDGWGMLDSLEGAKKTTRKRGKTKRGWSTAKQVSGEVIRKGETIAITEADPERLSQTFSVPNIQYGNWMTQADREYHTKALEGAFHDMSEVLGIDPKQVSLNGRLSISMGGRGSGTAMAHYEPSKKIINLTKFAGGGTLAHEWGHALDNVIAEVSGAKSEAGGGIYLSESVNSKVLSPKVKTAIGGVIHAMEKAPDPVKARAAHKLHIQKKKIETENIITEHNNLSSVIDAWAYPNEVSDRTVARWKENIASLKVDLTRYIKDKSQAPESYVAKHIDKLRRGLASKEKQLSILETKSGMDKEQQDKHRVKLLADLNALRLDSNSARASFNAARRMDPEASNYYMSSQNLGTKYWGSTREMFARAFESHVEDAFKKQKRANTYLVDGTTARYGIPMPLPDGSNTEVYPQGDERKAISAAMTNLLSVLQESGELKKALQALSDLQKATTPDHTLAIAVKEGRGYQRVKSALTKKGYNDADFKKDGKLYGKSTNELIDLARGK